MYQASEAYANSTEKDRSLKLKLEADAESSWVQSPLLLLLMVLRGIESISQVVTGTVTEIVRSWCNGIRHIIRLPYVLLST